MNDLKNGILDINGFLLGPNTTIQEIEEGLHIKASGEREWKHFRLKFVDSEISFDTTITFDSKKLICIKLRPEFPDIAAKYNLKPYSEDWLPYFKELRVIMDKWLFEQLGEPSFKDFKVTEYNFKKIIIGTFSYVDEHSRDYCPVGGTVKIFYR